MYGSFVRTGEGNGGKHEQNARGHHLIFTLGDAIEIERRHGVGSYEALERQHLLSHDSFICATRLVYMCDMTHSYVHHME